MNNPLPRLEPDSPPSGPDVLWLLDARLTRLLLALDAKMEQAPLLASVKALDLLWRIRRDVAREFQRESRRGLAARGFAPHGESSQNEQAAADGAGEH